MDKELENRIQEALDNLVVVSSVLEEDEYQEMLFEVYRLILDLNEK